jgi:hypothetical protein
MNDNPTQSREVSSPGFGFRITGRFILGLAVLALGVLWTLDNLDLVDASRYMQYWPAILVAVGLAKLVAGRSGSERMSGVIWTFIGGWLLLHSLGYVHVSIWRLWPVFLILIGLSMVVRSMGGNWDRGRVDDAGSTLGAFAMMSGVDRKQTSQSFQGGDVTAIMGGCEIDLRQASMVHSPVIVDVFAFWGGIDIRIPGDWTLRNEVVAILGGIEDSRKDVAGSPDKVVVIRGLALMGGIEIKN